MIKTEFIAGNLQSVQQVLAHFPRHWTGSENEELIVWLEINFCVCISLRIDIPDSEVLTVSLAEFVIVSKLR